MTLVRWDPLQQLVAMTNRLNRTLNDPYMPRTEDAFGAWTPPVDIFEKQDHLVIRAEIPGAPGPPTARRCRPTQPALASQ